PQLRQIAEGSEAACGCMLIVSRPPAHAAASRTWFGSVFLRQIVKALVMRHDDLQRAVACMRIGFAAIETRYGPGPAGDFGIEPDDNDAPCLLAIRKTAQLGRDHVLDFGLGLRKFVHADAFARTSAFAERDITVAVRAPGGALSLRPHHRGAPPDG